MKRDGVTISLWQDAIPEYTPQTVELPAQTVDVLIVGGGITGITTALLLQKAGKTCVIAEAQNLCFGTTGGTTSHINSFFDTSYDQIQSDFGESGAQLVAKAARQALDLFQQQVNQYNIDCGYAEKDAYLYAQTEEQISQLEKIMDASVQAGVEVAYAPEIPVPVSFQKAIVYSRNAQIHPSRYVYALAKEFEQAGGVILQQCTVTNLKNDTAEILEAETSRGVIKARNLIYATHIPPGINLLHFRCAPYRSYAMAVKLAGGNYPKGLAYDMYEPYHYYRTQEIDGEQYLIVGGEDHKTAHVANTDACFAHLEAHIRKLYPDAEITHKWSSQYFEPSDGLPYIGNLPGHGDNVYVATGYSGNGITYSHIAALVLSDLLTKGSSEYADLYNPKRVKPVAGFKEFIKENVDVAKEFFAKRFSQEQLQQLADLAAGEGRVVKFEGESIALYKDEQGALHAVSPVCPHAMCVVDWNSAEKSWDCPCHGSRFSIDGALLTGPARKGLAQIDLSQLVEK